MTTPLRMMKPSLVLLPLVVAAAVGVGVVVAAAAGEGRSVHAAPKRMMTAQRVTVAAARRATAMTLVLMGVMRVVGTLMQAKRRPRRVIQPSCCCWTRFLLFTVARCVV